MSKAFKKKCEQEIENLKSYVELVKFCDTPVMKDCCKQHQVRLIAKFTRPRIIQVPFTHRRMTRGGVRRTRTRKSPRKLTKTYWM